MTWTDSTPMKHTPGPWAFGQCKKMGSVDGKARLVDRPGWFISAEARKLDLAEVHCTSSQNKAEQRANAVLIANAPCLLKAALAVLDLVESEGRDTGLGDAFSDLREAIEYATGQIPM